MTIKAAVIGDPIDHSLSPKIHNFLLKKYGIDGQYEAIKIEKNNLKQDVQKLVDEGFAGFNVTIPHKEEIFKICDDVSEVAKLIGAVNTVVITKDKKIVGHNSDAQGFMNNLYDSFPNFDFKNKSAFLIGAGGAARSIVYGLITSGVKKIFITNRSRDRFLLLQKHFAQFCAKNGCEINFLDAKDFEKNLGDCDLLINSTSLGMKSQESLALDLTALKKSAIVYDIVYNPLMTELLNGANLRGNKIITGIGMLVHQAFVGFEMWFKKKPEIDDELIKSILKN